MGRRVNLLSIDPGEDHAACLWVDGKLEWAAFRALPAAITIDHLIIEDQEISRRTRNPKSILRLAQSAGRLAERVHATKETWVTAVRWMSGSPPHFVLEARILGCLSPEERRVLQRALSGVAIGKRHNVVDSAGIGLFALRRLPRR